MDSLFLIPAVILVVLSFIAVLALYAAAAVLIGKLWRETLQERRASREQEIWLDRHAR